MRHLGHGGRVPRSGEIYSGNLFASSFLQKDKKPFTHHRRSKYDAGREIRTGTPESSAASKLEIPKLPSGESGTN